MVNVVENITKRKDGRFMGRFIIGYDEKGKALYQYVYGKTYDEAREKVMIGRAVESRFLSGKKISVRKAYAEWLNAAANRVKESSAANYRMKFEKHILPEFGDMLCSELSAEIINAFIRKKLADGLSAGYIRDIFIVFKTMLKYAQEEYNFKLSLKNIALPKCEKKEVKKIDDTEQNLLVMYLKQHMDMTSFGILVSLLMGLRIGELCGLKWNDVDFKNKVIRIGRTVQRISSVNGNRKTTCTENGTKTIACTRCDETKTEEIKALGHDWDSGTVTKEATCTENGTKTIACTRCDETKTEESPALGHDWDEWTATKEATAYEEGEEERECKTCGEKETRAAGKLPAETTTEAYIYTGGLFLAPETAAATSAESEATAAVPATSAPVNDQATDTVAAAAVTAPADNAPTDNVPASADADRGNIDTYGTAAAENNNVGNAGGGNSDNQNLPTGIVFSVIPAAAAALGVAIFKKRK